jgi:hypothetical protein
VDDVIVKCWCGVYGPATEMFQVAFLDEDCGGWGHRICRCGGDSCICHHHGGAWCEGCPACREDEVPDVAG